MTSKITHIVTSTIGWYLSQIVKSANGTFSKRIMHAIVEYEGDLDMALKAAETAQDVDLLVKSGAIPATQAGTAAVFEAARSGRAEVICELVKSGAAAGTEALLIAVTNRHYGCVAELVKQEGLVTPHVAYAVLSIGDMDILRLVMPEHVANVQSTNIMTS